MPIELFFKVKYVRRIPKWFGMEQVLTQFAVKICFDDSTDFYEMNNYFASEADITIGIVYYLDKDKFRIFTLSRNIY